MEPLICAIDLGTTTTKAALVARGGAVAATAQVPSPSMDLARGDLDAEAAVAAGLEAARRAVAQVVPSRVVGITVTGQRATVVPVGGDGRVAALARSWMSPAEAGAEVYERVGASRFRELTGLVPMAIYSAVGIVGRGWHRRPEWRLTSLPDLVLRRLGAGDLWTDPSLAAATGLSRLDRGGWCGEILDALGISESQLPRQAPGGREVGRLGAGLALTLGLPVGTPLLLAGGDQQCAVLGAGALEPGTAVLSTGTAAALVLPTDRLPASPPAEVLAMAHALPGHWVLEGFVPAFGSAVDVAAAELGLAGVEELEEHAEACAGRARAVYEGLAAEVGATLEATRAHQRVRHLLVVGGAARSAFLARCLAEATGCTVARSERTDAAPVGAAVLAWSGLPSQAQES